MADCGILAKNWKHNEKYKLKVDVIGKGSVQKSRGHADGKTANADVIELTATAEPGWIFSGWNGNLSGLGNPHRVTLDEDKIISATFTQKS